MQPVYTGMHVLVEGQFIAFLAQCSAGAAAIVLHSMIQRCVSFSLFPSSLLASFLSCPPPFTFIFCVLFSVAEDCNPTIVSAHTNTHTHTCRYAHTQALKDEKIRSCRLSPGLFPGAVAWRTVVDAVRVCVLCGRWVLLPTSFCCIYPKAHWIRSSSSSSPLPSSSALSLFCPLLHSPSSVSSLFFSFPFLN